MILADTSVWVDHFRSGIPEMRTLLESGQITTHPFVIAELALGSLSNRTRTLAFLDLLPHTQPCRMSEVRKLIEARSLFSCGIGLTDAHLLGAVLLVTPTQLWTRDKRLRRAAEKLGVHGSLP
jgi:hypothetical protein